MAYSLLLLPRKLAKTRVLHYIRLFFPTTVGFSRMCVCVCVCARVYRRMPPVYRLLWASGAVGRRWFMQRP